MKRVRNIGVAVLTLLMLGCYEVNEDIEIKADGSGTYATRMDMSALIEMAQSFAGEEELAKGGLDRVIDTTILMKHVLDSAKDATPEQKRLLNDGTMKLKMNFKEKIFKADIRFPYKSHADLQTLMSGSGSGGLGEIFKKVFSKDTAGGSTSMPAQDQGLDQISQVYDVTVTKNTISRKLNKEKYQALMGRPELAQAKQMMGSVFEILYTTTLKLPRPVKRADNPDIKLSPDKRTATFRYDLLKMLDTPEKFAYTIEY